MGYQACQPDFTKTKAAIIAILLLVVSRVVDAFSESQEFVRGVIGGLTSYWRAATRASVGVKCTPTLRPGSIGGSKASLNTNNSPSGVSTKLSMRLPK